MDLISTIEGVFFGAIGVLTVWYGYARTQGVVSDNTAAKLEEVQANYEGLQKEVKLATGNISLPEVGGIFHKGTDLIGMINDGKIEIDDASLILGKMVIDAMKD